MAIDYATTMIKRWDENSKKLEAQDSIAKAKKQLVNRYIKLSVADGYAFYEIVKETKSKVHIKLVTGIGDDYRVSYFGDSAIIDKSYAKSEIESRDQLAKLFGKAR